MPGIASQSSMFRDPSLILIQPTPSLSRLLNTSSTATAFAVDRDHPLLTSDFVPTEGKMCYSKHMVMNDKQELIIR